MVSGAGANRGETALRGSESEGEGEDEAEAEAEGAGLAYDPARDPDRMKALPDVEPFPLGVTRLKTAIAADGNSCTPRACAIYK